MRSKRTAEYRLIQVYITIPDFKVVATIRIGAYPGLVVNCCPLTAKIGQGHQHTNATPLTFGELHVFQWFHLPSKKIHQAYTKNDLLANSN